MSQHKSYHVHEIAKRLQSMDEIDKIGARVVGREPYHYLVNQSDVAYDQLHCVQDVHLELREHPLDEERLQELEETYGRPFLTPYLNADRNLQEYEHAEQQRMIQNWLEFYIDLFDKFEPDFVLAQGIAASHTWMPFDLVQYRGGTALSWFSTRIGNRYAFTENTPLGEFADVRNLFESLHGGDADVTDYPEAHFRAKAYVEDIRSEGTRPGYFCSSTDRSILRSIKNAAIAPARYLRYAYLYHISRAETNFIRNDLTRPSVTERIRNDLLSSYQQVRTERTDYFDTPREDKDFAFFPLHLQPEAALMIGAPMYTNQIAAVEQVSDSLPIGHKLYVKDHPNMAYQRPLSYYERLADIPNVRLIDPRRDSHELIRRSDLVTTITGTAGFEAAMLQTPTITFGNCYYNTMPMIAQSSDPHDLSNMIYRMLTEYEHDEEQLIDFLTAVFQCSFEFLPRDEAGAEERAQAVFPHLKQKMYEYIS